MACLDPGDTDRTTPSREAWRPAAHGPPDCRGRWAGRPSDRSASGPDPIRIVEILSHELRSPITTIHLGTKVLAASGGDIPVPGPARGRRGRRGGGRAPVPARRGPARGRPARRRVANPLAGPAAPPPALAARDHRRRGARRAPAPRARARSRPTCRRSSPTTAALAHVLRNLLANAARYAADGMPVEVVARRARHGSVSLDVLDRGPGFDPRARRCACSSRSTAARRLEATGSGAGLGLAAATPPDAGDGRRPRRGCPRDGGGARFRPGSPSRGPDDEPRGRRGSAGRLTRFTAVATQATDTPATPAASTAIDDGATATTTNGGTRPR